MTQPQSSPPQNTGPLEQVNEPPISPGLTALEAAFAALVLAALTAWLAKVALRVLAPWRLWRMAPDPGAIWATSQLWHDAIPGLINWLRSRAARAGWERFVSDHPSYGSISFNDTDSYVQAHLATVRNFLVRIPQEVFEQIRRELIEGNDQGESVPEVAARIEKVLNVTGSENWPHRAMTIGITEVNGASNAGWFAAAQRTERDLGVRLEKVWLASHDDRVRPTHRQADGQRRRLGEPFLVGGWPLLYPGDKNGPPEEVINCRCAAATEGTR